MNSCLDEQQLRDLAAGGVDEAISAKWRAHIDVCPECSQALHEWEENLQFAQELHANLPSTPFIPVSESTLSWDGDLVSAPLTGDSHSPATDRANNSNWNSSELPQLQDYRIIRELSSGGQGAVYEAVQLSTRRTIALKLLLEGPGASRRSQQRFEREIELIASLRHPNIVAVHDSGITRGQYYYAMDYVRGEPLDTHVRMTRLNLRAVMRLFKTVCDAMAYAHRQGVIHRDLKPSNILVDAQGRPFVLDFGLARVLGTTDHTLLTLPGVVLGTVPYMSPEQTAGRPDGVDMRTDVYTLGVILYELLTGSPPYEARGGDLAKAFENIRTADPPRPSKLNRQANAEIDAIALKAMEKDPNRRYGSASEMAEDVTAWLEGRPVQARSASSLYVLRKLVAKHSFESLVTFTLVVALGAFGAIAVQSYRQGEQALARAARSDRAKADADWIAAQQLYGSDLPHERQLKLGWFLLEWRADRFARAKAWQSALSPTSPEFAVTGFLLDEQETLDELIETLPDQEHPLAWFAAGERATKQNRIDEAIRAFETCMSTPGAGWMKGAVRARLDQLAQPPQLSASGSEP